MAIAPGARIGIYEVVSQIGAGGMGEVYLARDTQLGRNVALKVLPDVFASDTERLARFRREAQVLAALHHPNIAVIYGFEDADGARALVLEYIEGDTLADRIGAGPVAVDEALTIARQIAEALQAAHDQGVIHRDLKPSNIKLTSDGAVKVLDFGLAKLASTAEAASGPSASVSLSPTITSPAATMVGVILGTAAYMAPEQAKGKPADKRSDVWAFGCVLFEMLSGQRAFEGDDISETLASVIKGQPDWSVLPTDVPLPVKTLLRSCLTKDPRARLTDIAGAMFVLRNTDALVAPAPATSAARAGRRWSWRLAAPGVLLLAVLVAASGWIGWKLRPDDPLQSLVTTYGIALPEGESFTNISRQVVAVSPDATLIVYAAANRLNLRPAGRIQTRALRGTEGSTGLGAPRGPFFSPDSQWIAFWSGNQLKKISVNDGAAQTLATVSTEEQPAGSHWTDEGTIVFAGNSGIWSVSEHGGTPALLVKAEGQRRFLHPQLLPGGRAVLFTALPIARTGWDQADVIVRLLDGGIEKRIAGGTDARYLPTGHVVFVVRGVLTALAFDAKSLTTFGGPIPLVEGIVESPVANGTVHFDISPSGTLAYVASTLTAVARTPMWIDRQGRETPLGPGARPYLYLRISPDQTRVAFDIGGGGNRDIWMWDVEQRAMRPLTTDAEPDRAPMFTLDSRRIVYTINRGGGVAVVSRFADGVGAIEEVVKADASVALFPLSIAQDGTLILRRARGDSAEVDVFTLPPGRGSTPKPLIAEPFREENAILSHNGKWIAYQTNRSGRDEVVVRPYPAFNSESPVSTAGGTEPLWSSDDSELFFRSPSGAIMRVRVTPRGDAWNASVPEQQVIPGDGLWVGIPATPLRTYDVSGDGRRFLVLKNAAGVVAEARGPNIIVIENWSEELKRRVPVK